MEILGMILVIVGALIAIVFGIQLLIVAFQTSVLWGLGYLFVPFVALIFVIVHWDVARKPFLRGLIAIPFYALGILLVGSKTL
jgi:hypothetical protein